MKQVDIGSKNCVEVDGDMVKIHNFSESFPKNQLLFYIKYQVLFITFSRLIYSYI